MQEKKKQYILDNLLRIILAMFVLTVLFAFSCLLLSHGARGIWLAVLAQFTLLGVLGGVCSPLDPVSYFKWALENTRDIAKAFESLADKTVGKQEVDAVVASKLPNLNGAVRLSCKGENVSSVYILYEWGNQPGNPIKTKGGQNGYGNCPKQFTFPSKPND